jgi:hypothetical protein
MMQCSGSVEPALSVPLLPPSQAKSQPLLPLGDGFACLGCSATCASPEEHHASTQVAGEPSLHRWHSCAAWQRDRRCTTSCTQPSPHSHRTAAEAPRPPLLFCTPQATICCWTCDGASCTAPPAATTCMTAGWTWRCTARWRRRGEAVPPLPPPSAPMSSIQSRMNSSSRGRSSVSSSSRKQRLPGGPTRCVRCVSALHPWPPTASLPACAASTTWATPAS